MTIFGLSYVVTPRGRVEEDDVTGDQPVPPDLDDARRLTLLLESVAMGRIDVTIETPGGGQVSLRAECADAEAPVAPSSLRAGCIDDLSAAERHALRLAARGMRGAAIAQTLGLPLNAVAELMMSIRHKLNVTSTADAVSLIETARPRGHSQHTSA